MRLNKYQYLENKETYLLIVFFIFSFFIRIPIIFLYGDTSLENEWYLLVNSLAEHGTLSMKNFGDLFVPNLFMPPLYPYYLYFFKSNILLKISVSTTKIKIINLTKSKDLIIGSYCISPGQLKACLFNIPGLRY